jgi:hypothetical protein
MIFRERDFAGLRNGTITLAFRRWRRPTVKAGGTLLTAGGQLEIVAVDEITPDEISDRDARAAGFASRRELLDELNERVDGVIYRVTLGTLRPDPRVALRERPADSDGERQLVIERLRRLDARAPGGPWTRRVLELIRAHPGVRAGNLCSQAGQDLPEFKTNVRKLKALGLTESLEVGYRLSPRGRAYLAKARAPEGG